jgi:hypothetical protein
MVPMYKWFPDTNGSQVQMVPRYKWFPGTNGSQYQNMTGENQNINWTLIWVLIFIRRATVEEMASKTLN